MCVGGDGEEDSLINCIVTILPVPRNIQRKVLNQKVLKGKHVSILLVYSEGCSHGDNSLLGDAP